MLLEINNSDLYVRDKRIVSGFNLHVDYGDVYALLGPNGSGKTSLLKAIMGLTGYKLTGDVRYEGQELLNLSLDERARRGIFLSYQHPPEIVGVRTIDFLDKIRVVEKDEMEQLIDKLRLRELISREVNRGFSGGERKRLEVLQGLIKRPKLLLLDEIDSGVDVESIRLIANTIQEYVDKNRDHVGVILVTHQAKILEYITSNKACVVFQGQGYCYPDPEKVVKRILEVGYSDCIDCEDRVEEER